MDEQQFEHDKQAAGLRRWALWSFKCLDFDLEALPQTEQNVAIIDNMIRAWDFYTLQGMDAGSAALRVLTDIRERAEGK